VADTLRYPPMSKITFQKIIFPENRTNNSTYRHQKQSKSWGGEIRRSRGDLPTISGNPPKRKSYRSASKVIGLRVAEPFAWRTPDPCHEGHVTLSMGDTWPLAWRSPDPYTGGHVTLKTPFTKRLEANPVSQMMWRWIVTLDLLEKCSIYNSLWLYSIINIIMRLL
jgi:hypothetical protein